MGLSDWTIRNAVDHAEEAKARFFSLTAIPAVEGFRVGLLPDGFTTALTIQWSSSDAMDEHAGAFPRFFRSLPITHERAMREQACRVYHAVRRRLFGQTRHLPYPGWIGSAVGRYQHPLPLRPQLGTFGCVLIERASWTPFGITCAHVVGREHGTAVVSVCGSRAHKGRIDAAVSTNEVLLGRVAELSTSVASWDCSLVQLDRDISLTNCLPEIRRVRRGPPADIMSLSLGSPVEKYGVGSFHTTGFLSGVVISSQQPQKLGEQFTASTLYEVVKDHTTPHDGTARSFCTRGDSGSLVVSRDGRYAMPLGILVAKTRDRLVNAGLVVSLAEVCEASRLEVA